MGGRVKKVLILMAVVMLAGCTASQQRELKTLQSNWSGLDRIVTVYNYDGSILATYEGKIDIQSSEGGKVLFDYEGKRIIYYNMPVSVIEK